MKNPFSLLYCLVGIPKNWLATLELVNITLVDFITNYIYLRSVLLDWSEDNDDLLTCF